MGFIKIQRNDESRPETCQEGKVLERLLCFPKQSPKKEHTFLIEFLRTWPRFGIQRGAMVLQVSLKGGAAARILRGVGGVAMSGCGFEVTVTRIER